MLSHQTVGCVKRRLLEYWSQHVGNGTIAYELSSIGTISMTLNDIEFFAADIWSVFITQRTPEISDIG